VTDSDFSHNDHVTIGETRLAVRNDNRVFINSGAAQSLARPEPATISDAERRLERENRALRQRHQSSDEDSPWVVILVGFFIVILVVAGYLRFRDTINFVSTATAAFLLAFILSAVVFAAVRRVVLDAWLKLQVGTNLLLGVVVLVGIQWLSRPRFASDDDRFQELLVAGRTASISSLLEDFGMEWILFVAYQLLGLALLLASMTLILLHTTKVYTIIGLAVRVQANPSHVAGRPTRWLLNMLGTPRLCWFFGFFLTAISLLLISGAGYTLVQGFTDASLISGPSPANAQ